MSASVDGDRRARGVPVSVIVPSYNHAPYVRAAIASVLAQTHAPVELVVIDDASTDGSDDVIAAACADRPFTFLRNERNAGLNPSLERALGRVTGEFVSLLASDDQIVPTKIAEQVAFLQARGLDGVFSTGWLLHPDGSRELVNLDRLERMFADGSVLRHMYTRDTYGPLLQSGLFRTEMLRALAPVRRSYKSDDWALTIAMLESYRIGFLNAPVFLYRQHAQNTFRNYWRTLPMRAEVVCTLTPEPMRREGLANLLESQGSYIAGAGGRSEGARYRLAALALDPSAARLVGFAKEAARPLVGAVRSLVRRDRRASP